MASGDSLQEGILLGMCNPLLDIQAEVDPQFIDKYGLNINDAILAEDKHLPLFEELIKNYKVNYVPGGANQNALRVFQWIVGQPSRSVFFGAVGNDDYGSLMREKSTEAGVRVCYQVSDAVKTGTCAALVHKQHRSLCADLAAANTFTIDHLKKPENRAVIERAQYFAVSGFFITVCTDGILYVAEHAARENKLFSLNLSAPFVSLAFREQLDKIIPYVDLLFANEQEVEAYAQAHGWDLKEPAEIAKRLVKEIKVNEKQSRVVVVTQGAQPVLVAHGDTLDSYDVPPLAPERIVDTIGAGDAFCGGFFAQLIQHKSYAECVKCGTWAASVVIAHNGCTFDPELKYPG